MKHPGSKSGVNPAREVRLVRLAQFLRRDRPVSCRKLQEELEVSRATLMRDIGLLRDQLNMPIAYDREANGYFIATEDIHHGPRYEIPGLWLSTNQAAAILTLLNVCLAIDPGILSSLRPLRSLFKQIVGLPRDPMPAVEDKLAFELGDFRMAYRKTFEALSRAMYQEKRVELRVDIKGFPSGRFSPQRFVLTTHGWVLDAMSHRKREIVRIPIAAIESVRVVDVVAEYVVN
ncbi:MAG: HTH domain-containing protein [Anaerolineales bacterium]|nr:HTH domain-containing protein [Anaerolineales bacterium]